MQTEKFLTQNVKCGGCVNNIQQGLSDINSVSQVSVSIETGEVTVEGENLDRELLSNKLSELGYPVSG